MKVIDKSKQNAITLAQVKPGNIFFAHKHPNKKLYMLLGFFGNGVSQKNKGSAVVAEIGNGNTSAMSFETIVVPVESTLILE